MSPVIILVRPQLGENIGAAARAMANFGLKELRLVAPRDPWPNRKALEMAADGRKIAEAAKLYESFGEAMADIGIAYATTARPRDMEKRVVTPEEAAREILQHASPPYLPPVNGGDKKNTPPACGGSVEGGILKVALVFGPERTGLENDDIVLCDTLVTIPTTEHSSLNLGQSAVVVLYEWFKQGSGVRDQGAGKQKDFFLAAQTPDPCPLTPAPKKDWQEMFDQLEACLDEAEYFRVAHKKPLMWQNTRNMLLRGGWNAQEVRTFRGMIRSLWEGRNGRKKR